MKLKSILFMRHFSGSFLKTNLVERLIFNILETKLEKLLEYG